MTLHIRKKKKVTQKFDKKKHIQQNIICSEEHIYTSPENFIRMLSVLFVTFRRYGLRPILKLNIELLVWRPIP